MFKLITIMTAIFQTLISVIANDRGEILVEPKVEPVVEPIVEPIVEPVVEVVPTKTDLLRDLSKEHGVNLFDVEGIKKFKEYQESQKTDLDKKDEVIEIYKSKETEWQSKELGYQSKIEASRLNIAPENLDDAMKLAGGDPTKLEEVVKKYPTFKSKKGIKIGVQGNDNFQNIDGQSEAEAYMATHPKVYGSKTK